MKNGESRNYSSHGATTKKRLKKITSEYFVWLIKSGM